MKKKLILIFIFSLYLFSIRATKTEAENCSAFVWVAGMSNGVCAVTNNMQLASDPSSCDPAQKPAPATVNGATLNPYCCCKPTPQTQTQTNVQTGTCSAFVWVEGASNNVCGGLSYNMQIASDPSSCDLSQKPAPATVNGATLNPYCCCKPTPKTQANTQTPSTPPKFIIPQFQVPIDTIKLSTPTSTNSHLVAISSNGNYTYEIPWIAEYIQGIYTYGLDIGGILAALMLMAGGLLWLISGGDASKVTQAKELITGSITGLIILFSSYIILTQINPNLTLLPSISLGNIKKAEFQLLAAKSDSTADSYRDTTCATDDELQNGVQFYATGYYKAPWGTSHHDLCMIAMQCNCPDLNNDNQPDVDTSSDCTDVFPNYKRADGQPYRPCKAFPQGTTYCNKTASGKAPSIGSIAGPTNCSNLPYKPGTTQVCFKGKTYTILDTGGAIKGRRIDIWSSSLEEANAQTGVGTLTKGACK
jgi:hypothetical protein